MEASDVRQVLLVRAFEEADGQGALLSPRERVEATESAEARTAGDPAEATLLVARAEALLERLGTRAEGVPRALAMAPTDVPLGWLLPVVALLLGLGTAALGRGRYVHLLQAPILVLIAGNVLIYLLFVLRRLGLLRRPVEAVRGALVGLAGRAGRLAAKRLGARAEGRTAVAADAYRRYAAHWTDAAGPLLVARAARTLHVSALLLMVGAVVSLYVRGIATEFRVVWESTFLDAGQVEAILRLVLAPGLAVLGGDVAPIAPFRVGEGGGDGQPAARWAHLYAISAVAWVVAPRALLAWFAGWRGKRLERRLPLDTSAPYYRRLLAGSRGKSVHVQVLPYSHTPTARARDRLAGLLRDTFGARAVTSTSPPVPYGSDLPEMSDGTALVVVMNLAQTPEYEVHGRFIQLLRDRAGKAAPLVVLVDAAAYRSRLGGGAEAERRVSQRRVAWSRHVTDAGLVAVHVDLAEDPTDRELEDTVAGVWPAGSLA